MKKNNINCLHCKSKFHLKSGKGLMKFVITYEHEALTEYKDVLSRCFTNAFSDIGSPTANIC